MNKQSKIRGNVLMILFFIYSVLLQIIFSLVISFLPSQTIYSSVIQILFQGASFLIPLAIYLLYTKKNIKDVLFLKPISIKLVILTILLTFSLQPSLTFINSATMMFFKNVSSTFVDKLIGEPFILVFTAIAVMPSFCEEAIFRGVLLTEYEKEPMWRSLLISGLFFGIMHSNFSQFFYAFFAGMVFAYILKKSGSIIPAMIAHFTINGFQVLILKLATVLRDFSPEFKETYEASLNQSSVITLEVVKSAGIFALYSLPFFIMFLLLFNRASKSNLEKRKSKENIVLEEIELEEINIDTENIVITEKKQSNLWYYLTIVIIIIMYLPIAYMQSPLK